MKKLKSLIEWNAFGICTALGLQLGISTSRIRQYFIYASVMTLGSPIIVYLILVFWRDLRKYMQSTRRNPWHSL
ncbi:MAG: PspC family transcriptional regulator [Bacteroidetes bacterium]|nr:PspC family transcriptional regulator [Bacteroidota bacterium]